MKRRDRRGGSPERARVLFKVTQNMASGLERQARMGGRRLLATGLFRTHARPTMTLWFAQTQAGAAEPQQGQLPAKATMSRALAHPW